MNSMNTAIALDFKTTAAILNANPEGVTIIGAWNTMETLAREDPEGCVRLSPGLPMDNTALAGFFHCTVAVVEKTIEVFEKLKRITVKDGLIKVLGYGEGRNGVFTETAINGNSIVRKTVRTKPALTEEALARKREQDRIRKARSRARQKQEQAAEKESNVALVAGCDNRCDRRDRERDMCDNKFGMCDNKSDFCNNGRDANCDAAYTTTAEYNRNNNIHPLHPSPAYKPVSSYLDLDNLIPLHELPEECRNVIGEWNRLPLPKFKGLVPKLLDKLKYLLQRYGENTLCKTISGIANNAFLLGKKEGHTWTVSLGWLLEPENFAKVLSGKYQDQKYGDSRRLNWRPGERLPFYLPGEGEEGFTPEEQEQALRDLFVPTTPVQLKAARLVGLPGYDNREAIA